MRWDPSHESRDVIDRRGERGPSQAGGGLGGLLFLVPWLMRSRLGRLVLVGGRHLHGRPGRAWAAALNSQRVNGSTSPQTGAQPETPEVHFVSFVLDDVQTSWETSSLRLGVPYRHAKLVLFTDATQTGCGFGDAATGPFYCPTDERVYIDLGFFRALSDKLGARGQFAQAYVMAHEIGHHVQKLLGISKRVDGMRSTQGATGASVRLELQADCFAGIWAHSTQQRDLLEAGDIESAIGAAAAVGDDRLQRQATGTVSPDSWTHGSSEERMRWFRTRLRLPGRSRPATRSRPAALRIVPEPNRSIIAGCACLQRFWERLRSSLLSPGCGHSTIRVVGVMQQSSEMRPLPNVPLGGYQQLHLFVRAAPGSVGGEVRLARLRLHSARGHAARATI